jgi:hypothetical protein
MAEEGRRRQGGLWRYPEDGLVLRTTTRDLPRPEAGAPPDDWRGKAWNQDLAWFKKEEARAFVPDDPKPGARRDVPASLVRRLATLSLVDNVRGETDPYKEQHVERAELVATVGAVEGGRVTLRLEGATRCVARGRWSIDGYRDMNKPSAQERGFESRLLGSADFDLKQGRFTRFDLLAIGTRWGATQYNVRTRDLGPAPIGASFELAGAGPADRVVPAFVWDYPPP